jgi:hypothetical protein
LLQIDQRVIELKATREGLDRVACFIFKSTAERYDLLQRPVVNVTLDSAISRPELQLYDNQAELVLATKQIGNGKIYPRQVCLQGWV